MGQGRSEMHKEEKDGMKEKGDRRRRECGQSKIAGIETKVGGREGKSGRRREKKTTRRYVRGRKGDRKKERNIL
jgi:hypothetical protein